MNAEQIGFKVHSFCLNNLFTWRGNIYLYMTQNKTIERRKRLRTKLKIFYIAENFSVK